MSRLETRIFRRTEGRRGLVRMMPLHRSDYDDEILSSGDHQSYYPSVSMDDADNGCQNIYDYFSWSMTKSEKDWNYLRNRLRV